MKKKNIILSLVIALALAVIVPLSSWAVGSAKVVLSPSSSSVALGSSVTVTMKASSTGTTTGIVSFSGTLDYDSSYLELTSSTAMTSPYTLQMNTAHLIAGMDNSLSNGIKDSTTVYTFVFKTLKTGTTKVTLTNYDLTDINDTLSTSVTDATITITEATTTKSSNANLSSLSVSGYSISPTFNKNTTSYTLSVPNSVSSVTINATKEDSTATINSGTGAKTLSVGSNTASVKVTAEDGTTKTYTITITRQAASDTPSGGETDKSSDATLSGLSVSGYSLSPEFDPSKLEYNLTVPNGATNIDVKALTSDSNATVNVTGNTNLVVGNNKVVVKVTAEDGTTKEYIINVTKEGEKDSSLSSDNTLKSLDVSGYTLNPTFNKDITSYTINVANTVTGLNVKAIPSDSDAKVEISGNLGWQVGVNTISIKVTAPNGDVKIYTVNAIRAGDGSSNGGSSDASSDATLKSLTINSSHTIDKEFNKNENSYSITVPYEVDKLDLSYITNNAKAKVEITGNENFKVGETNTVVIKVMAEDGTQNYYILNVVRNSENSETDLAKLVIGGADLNPKFDPDTTKYSVTVDADTDKLDISALTKDTDSEVEIIGNENLSEGHNTVWVKVTDKNGMTKLYEIDVYKESASTSTGTILGLKPATWGIILGILGVLLLFFLLLFLLLRRKKDEEEEKSVVPPQPNGPVIEFKPEFNFGSKNSSDDDVVHGNFNQASGEMELENKMSEPKRLIDAEETTYEEVEKVPYDIYDDTITKDEIVDAIHEAMETKDTAKLRMLLDQEELNKRKKEIREREELRNKEVDEDDFEI